MDFQKFQNPPNEYRPAPWWSMNDDLRDDKLVRQIGEMERGGFGDFFMGARHGRVTPCLTRSWLARVRTCVREAGKRSMLPWLYDEDKWPSGFAGGKVPARGPSMRIKTFIYVTGLMRPGTNVVEIEIANSLRNLLGPHHASFDKFGLMGPDQFEPEKMTTQDHMFVEFGLHTVHLCVS